MNLKFLFYTRDKKNRTEKGFMPVDEIERLIIIIMIGMLAAIALPNLLNQIDNPKEDEDKNVIKNINLSPQKYSVKMTTKL